MAVLITGGAGFIGSHTTVEMLNAGKDVIIVDDLSNSNEKVINRIEKITGKKPKFYKVNLLNYEETDKIFDENDIESVIHFASFKSVGESVEKPIMYYENNLYSTINLCKIMDKHNVKNLVFSSSATVYGKPETVPIREDFPLSTTNPYGTTKLFIERILKDITIPDKSWSIIILRYFNPIGAHESGLIGESPNGIPNNLLPYISKVAYGQLPYVKVFGNDYDTIDGTGVRDYIHVVDLAKAHLNAEEYARTHKGIDYFNIGTGKGYSVLEIIQNFEKVSGKKINYKIAPRRPGDIAICYADSTKAEKELHWKAKYGIDKMCEDLNRWQEMNPNGYND